MCRLFVFNSDTNTSADKALDALKFKLGHVIDVLEDGQFGGNDVEGLKASGLFQIVEMPGVPAEKYRYLCDSDPVPLSTAQRTTYPRLRINIMDVAALKITVPPDAQTKVITVPSEKVVTDLVTVVQPVPVSDVIGGNPLVIG